MKPGPEPTTMRNPIPIWSASAATLGICGGRPVLKGTRVTLCTVLASLADGDSAEDLLANFPSLKHEDIKAAIAFAAASAEGDLPISEVPRMR